jgi:hypothetical protein
MIDTLKKEFGKFIFYPINGKCESYIFDEEIESCLVLMGHNSGYYSKKSFSNCIVKTFFPREITIETHRKLYENLTFSYCVFSNFDFKGIEFDSVQFKNCVFLDCNFEFVEEMSVVLSKIPGDFVVSFFSNFPDKLMKDLRFNVFPIGDDLDEVGNKSDL